MESEGRPWLLVYTRWTFVNWQPLSVLLVLSCRNPIVPLEAGIHHHSLRWRFAMRPLQVTLIHRSCIC